MKKIACLLACVGLYVAPALAQEPPAWISGSWYNTDRSGEGFVVQLLDNGVVVVGGSMIASRGDGSRTVQVYTPAVPED